MPVFNTIDLMRYPSEEMREDIIVKKVAKKDISRGDKDLNWKGFVPVFLDRGNR